MSNSIKSNTELWLRGLAAAAIGGAAGAATVAFAVPDAFSFTRAGSAVLVKAIVAGAVVPTMAYLKQSPLPDREAETPRNN